MAPVKIEVGDFVEYKNKTCLIVEVQNTIGYNTYSLLNLDTGIKTHSVLRFQLDKLDINDNVDGDIALPDNPTDAVLVQQPVNVAAVEKASLPVGRAAEPTDSVAPPRKRFKEATQEDVERLGDASTSVSTDRQTRWAVKALKGKHLHVCMYNYSLLVT